MNNLSGTYCFSHRSFSTTKLPLRKSICSRKSYPYLKQVIFFIFLNGVQIYKEMRNIQTKNIKTPYFVCPNINPRKILGPEVKSLSTLVRGII